MVTHTTGSNATRGYTAVIAAAVIWGLNGTLVQYVLHAKQLDIQWLLTLRLLLPGLILLGITAGKNGFKAIMAVWLNPKDALAQLAFGAGMMAVQFTFFAAIRASNAATATIIQFSAPAIVAAYYLATGFKAPKGREILVILLAIAGTFLIATHGNINTIVISPAALAWGIASAAALAFYSIQPVRLLHKYKPDIAVGWSMLLGGLVFCCIHAPWQVGGVWDVYTVINVVFIVIPGGLIAFSLYMRGVKRIGGYIAMLLTSFEPLSATIISIVWLHIPFGLPEVIGGLLIISTIFLLPRNKAAE